MHRIFLIPGHAYLVEVDIIPRQELPIDLWIWLSVPNHQRRTSRAYSDLLREGSASVVQSSGSASQTLINQLTGQPSALIP